MKNEYKKILELKMIFSLMLKVKKELKSTVKHQFDSHEDRFID